MMGSSFCALRNLALMMKRKVSLLLAVIVCLAVVPVQSFAEVPGGFESAGAEDDVFKKERRIFLWDVTISMVGATQNSAKPKGKKRANPDFNYSASGFPYYDSEKDIFDRTREILINKIEEIKNESTEIIVLPFRNGIVGEFRANATAEGKEQLKQLINSWNDLVPGGTFTATCLKQAVDTYFTGDRTNRIILLTDGEPTGDEGHRLLKYINEWKGLRETKGTGCYLVYVMLTDEADSDDIKKVARSNPDEIQVIPPDVNVGDHVFISIARTASIYVRDCFNGKISDEGKGELKLHYTFVDGNEIPDDSEFCFTIEENEYISIDPSEEIEPEDGFFIVPFKFKKSFEEIYADLPHDSNLTLKVTCSKDEDSKLIDITGGSSVDLALVVKPEPRATISWKVMDEDED